MTYSGAARLVLEILARQLQISVNDLKERIETPTERQEKARLAVKAQ